MQRRAHILLKTDADGADAWTDERIAEALDTTRMTVSRVRPQFVAEGLDATLHRKRPTGRQYRNELPHRKWTAGLADQAVCCS